MSHFTVMVVGEDPYSELAPFNENVFYPRHELERYKKLYEQKNDDRTFAEFLSFRYSFVPIIKGCEIPKEKSYFVIEKGEVTDVVLNYNPEGKWDWCSLGGRWSDFLLLKERDENGERQWADEGLKKDIDFEGMIKDSVDSLSEDYDQKFKLIEPYLNEPYITYKEIEKKEPDANKVSDIYREQPIVKAFYEQESNRFDDIDRYLMPKDEFIERNKYNCITTFAFVHKGVWHERGEMGYFAVVSNPDKNWDYKFMKLLDAVGDDELISIFDCHI